MRERLDPKISFARGFKGRSELKGSCSLLFVSPRLFAFHIAELWLQRCHEARLPLSKWLFLDERQALPVHLDSRADEACVHSSLEPGMQHELLRQLQLEVFNLTCGYGSGESNGTLKQNRKNTNIKDSGHRLGREPFESGQSRLFFVGFVENCGNLQLLINCAPPVWHCALVSSDVPQA